ncbi:MAG: hypothetical protein ABI791_06245 [Acidobacteriota bacterium]
MKARNFVLVLAALGAACANNTAVNNGSNAGNANMANANASPAVQNLTTVERPQKIKDMMAARGEQDQAAPTLKIVEPAANASVATSTVKVKLNISGDLKGYTPHKDPETQMGNHIHVILDNQPYEAYYNLDQEFELRNVADGEHTLRVFPSRPWHESYKNEGAFQMVKFTVKGGGADANKPATTNSGQQMSNSNANSNANAAPAKEGKDMQNSNAGPVDPNKPLITFSRPKGEYKGADADAIMIDFWLSNAKLVGDGGDYRVRYSVDGGEAKFLDKWEPIWLSGWTAGKHSVKLELVDKAGNLVDNGGYNSTTREITITK